MHQLIRRVALGLTLPLVVGAPVVLIAGPAQANGPVLSVSTSEEALVYGQQATATAQVIDGEDPVTVGSVQFYIGPFGSEQVPFGPRVPLNAQGAAVSQILAQEDGRPLDITAPSVPWVIYAQYYDGADQVVPMVDDDASLEVTRSGSSIAVLPTATTLVADLTGQFPGGAQANSFKPDGGVVQFKVDGQVAGSSGAVNGKATVNYVLPPGSHTITATYSGDERYEGSSRSSSRKDPVLEARVLSMFPKSKSGWYHTAVDIWFVCKPQGSELVEDCPGDTSLKKSGKDQSVTRTIHAVDGGSATITVSGIDIDRDKPVITVKGRGCSATDKLSGVRGPCRMKIAANGHFIAIAQDKAGNRAVKRGVLD